MDSFTCPGLSGSGVSRALDTEFGDGGTDTGNDNTRRPKLASGKKDTKVGSQSFGYQIWFCTRLLNG